MRSWLCVQNNSVYDFLNKNLIKEGGLLRELLDVTAGIDMFKVAQWNSEAAIQNCSLK